METKEIDSVLNSLHTIKQYKKADKELKLEGISFRFKTVQFHLIDDTFEEMQKHAESFGDSKIYSERFSLPGYGLINEELSLTGEEYQFEIIIGVETELSQELYLEELYAVLETIEEKHGVDIAVLDVEEEGEAVAYNSHKIVFYTTKEGIFPTE